MTASKTITAADLTNLLTRVSAETLAEMTLRVLSAHDMGARSIKGRELDALEQFAAVYGD